MSFLTFRNRRWTTAAALSLALLLVLPVSIMGSTVTPSVYAQESSRLFPETGKTVKGKFLEYWNTHGGLAQQGLPISEEMQEESETDGKSYTVQYFERALFELHPQEEPEFQVLLSLLGVFSYNQKYQAGGAPNQRPNNETGSILVPETGKRLGGIFKQYWETHGGLAQQGYPISDEFEEMSDLNGKTYRVQYFQRAVFEYHPEEKPEFQVLLSQLGTFRHRAKYLQPASPTVIATSIASPTLPPTVAPSTPTAVPASAPPPGATAPTTGDCSGIPANDNMTLSDSCLGGLGGSKPSFTSFLGMGFTPNERVTLCIVEPGSQTCRTYSVTFTEPVLQDGTVVRCCFDVRPSNPDGLYMARMEGRQSGHIATGYFKIVR